GPTCRCSTSSPTCSSGRGSTRSTCSASPARSFWSAIPTSRRPRATPRCCRSSRCPPTRWRRCSTALCPACRTFFGRRSSYASLVRKEVLGLQADPRSPERGQYGFLQDLVKRVAYETLSKRERKVLHLAAAGYLETSWGPAEHEIVEVVASHYLAAYEAAPDAEDA